MPILVAGLAGLLFGSFASVLISRWYVDARPWWKGRSHCPHCGGQIAWYDNLPVVSWLWLRAQCRSCGSRISPVYPALELLMAGGWALVIALLGVSVIALALLGVWFASVVLAGIDLKHHRLPTPIIRTLAAWWIIVVVVPAVVGGQWDVVSAAAIGAVGLGGFYGLMWFIKPGAMGFGDVRLAAALGMILGSLSWPALAVGAIMGPLVGGIMGLVAILRARKARGVRVPYGPALLAGAWAGILVGDVVGPWYLGLFGAV